MNRLGEVFAPYWLSIQTQLFPWLEQALGPLTAKQQPLVHTLEIIRVTFEQRSFAATATFDSPCAHLRTIFARKATCRFVLARLASRSRSPRSTAVTSNLALGRPVLAMPPHTSHPAHFLKLFQTQGTSRSSTSRKLRQYL